jgi:hypothetical protein
MARQGETEYEDAFENNQSWTNPLVPIEEFIASNHRFAGNTTAFRALSDWEWN